MWQLFTATPSEGARIPLPAKADSPLCEDLMGRSYAMARSGLKVGCLAAEGVWGRGSGLASPCSRLSLPLPCATATVVREHAARTAHRHVPQPCRTGCLPTQDGSRMANTLDVLRRTIESSDHEKRIRELESTLLTRQEGSL
jgi:hypothetical protein